jgi:hypothetical protein
VRNAAGLRGPDRLAPARGRDRHLARDAAEPGAERAHVDEASIAVARRSAGEIRKVAIAAGVDEGPRLDHVRPAAIPDRDGADGIAVALRGNEAGVQEHVDPRSQHDIVEHALHGFGIEYDEHPAKPLRPDERAQRTQAKEHFLSDAADRGPGFWAERIEAAIGEHVA